MRRIVSSVAILLLLVTLLSPFFISNQAAAEATDSKVTLDGSLENWIMDQPRNSIYAVTSTGTLNFISMDTLSITHSLSIGGVSSDIVQEGNNLFIAIPDQLKVVEVNLDTQSIDSTITLPHAPNRIAVSKDKLFYVNDDTEYLYDYNLTSKTETEVTVAGESYSMFYEADLEADDLTDTLYIAESNLSGCNVKAISTLDYTLKSETTYDDGYGFDYSKRNLLLKENVIYFAGRALNASNLEDVQGEYVGTYSDEYFDDKRIPADILDVNDNYVFAKNGVYDRKTFVKLESTAFDEVLADNNNIYVFNSADNTITKKVYVPKDVSLNASLINGQLQFNHDLTDWVNDAQNHRIYAISKVHNELIYIDSDTLTVLGSQYVGSMPSDITLLDGKLYIANSGGTNISIASTTYGNPIQTVTTKQNPYKLATDGTNLYYVLENQWTSVYKVNLADGSETVLDIPYGNGLFSEPDLALDKDTNTLYIGESDSTGSDLVAISTVDYSVKGTSTYDEDYGFDLPNRNLFIKDNVVYYAGRAFDPNNLEDIKGEYVQTYSDEYFDSKRITANILDVNSDFVFGSKGVFDRNNFVKIEDWTTPASLIIADGDTLFTYNPDTSLLSKSTYSPKNISLNTTLANNRLSLNHQLTDWVFDDQNHRIYAISKLTDELIYINSDNMSVIGTQYVGSMPSDITLANGKLYIANSGGTNISVASTNYGEPIQTITTKQNPYKITTDGNILYYVDEDQWSFVYKVNLTDGTEKVLDVPNDNDAMSEPDLVYDSTTGTLYVGESDSSGANLYIVDTNDGTHLAQSDFDSGYGFPYPYRQLLLNGDDLFYSGYRLPKSDITNEAYQYFDDDIFSDQFEKYVFVNDSMVFSDKSIYNRATGEKLYTFPTGIELAGMSSTGHIFVYAPSTNAIYQFDSLDALKNQFVNNIQSAFNDTNQFQLTWDIATGDGYNVYDLTNPYFQKKLNGNLLSDTTFTLSDDLLKSYYGSTVTFGVGSSFLDRITPNMKSTTYTFEIPVPTNVNVSQADATSPYVVGWDAIKLMDSYNLYVSVDGGFLEKVNTEPLTTNSYTVNQTNLENWAGKTVSFQMTAVVNGHQSDLSEPVQYSFPPLVTTDPTQDQTPTGTDTSNDGGTTDPGSDQPTTNTGSSDPTSTNPDDTNQTSTSPDDTNQTSTDTSATQDTQETTNTTTATQTASPTSTDTIATTNQSTNVKTSDGQQVIKIEPVIENNAATIPDGTLDALKNGDKLNIDLTNDDHSSINVIFTASQVISLKNNDSDITIDKNNVGLSIPVVVFGTKNIDTKVNIKQLDNVDGALSNVYDFTIYQGSSTISHFDYPITLTFKVDPSKVTNPDDVKVYYWNETKKEWELIGGTYKDGIVTAETYHFSTYTVFEKKPKESEVASSDDLITKVASGPLNNSDVQTSSSSQHIGLWIGIFIMIVLCIIGGVFAIRKRA